MVTKAWRVYGEEGHKQKESFNDSKASDFSGNGITRKLEVENADKTGTNDYAILRITRDTAEDCEKEFWGQMDYGIFEHYPTGKVEEITEEMEKSAQEEVMQEEER